MGETPIAVVALEDGAQVTGEDLIGYARERLAHYKCPTRVEYVEELPRTDRARCSRRLCARIMAARKRPCSGDTAATNERSPGTHTGSI